MTKEEYIRIKQDPKADMNDVMFFYYLLKGGKVHDKQDFIHQMNSWLLAMSHGMQHLFKQNLTRLVAYVLTQMDKYYGIK